MIVWLARKWRGRNYRWTNPLFPALNRYFQHLTNEPLIGYAALGSALLYCIEQASRNAHVHAGCLLFELEPYRLELREIQIRQVPIDESFRFFVSLQPRNAFFHTVQALFDACSAQLQV